MKPFDYRIPVLFILMCIMVIGFTITKANGVSAEEVHHIYIPSDFKENYAIDLKEDGYLIVDVHDGECYFVPFGELEDWFLDMNL